MGSWCSDMVRSPRGRPQRLQKYSPVPFALSLTVQSVIDQSVWQPSPRCNTRPRRQLKELTTADSARSFSRYGAVPPRRRSPIRRLIPPYLIRQRRIKCILVAAFLGPFCSFYSLSTSRAGFESPSRRTYRVDAAASILAGTDEAMQRPGTLAWV